MAKKNKQSSDDSVAMAAAPNDASDEPNRWRELATSAATDFKERLGLARYLNLSDKDRERVARRLRDAIDAAMEVPEDLPARIQGETERLRQRGEIGDPVALAWQRTRERARRTAAVGAVTTLPAMIPVLGPAAAALGLVADWRYVAEQQRDLVLEIAAIFGVMPPNPTEQVRTLFLASAGTAFGSKAVGETVVKVAAGQVARRSLVRMIPGAGMAVSGALNYLATLAIGRAAIGRFGAQAGREVRGLAPAETHPRQPALRQAVVGALRTAELGDGASPAFSAEQRDALAELSPAERDELVDLAVVTAAADGETSEREEAALREITSALGVPPEELAIIRAAAEDDVVTYGQRFRRLFRSLREKGARGPRRIWQRARKLAKR